MWYKMQFDAIYCFSEVVIIQSHMSYSAFRMDDMRVLVVNNGERTESLCGVLKVRDVRTIEGQTYRIPCNLKCGDEVKLTVRHDRNSGYDINACIHMSQITAYSGLPIHYQIVECCE